jgi:hypothetical protein
MNDNRVADALHLLIDLKDRLEDLAQDLDRSYRPTVLFLTSRNLPGTDHLCDKLQAATTALDELREILWGVTYAGPDEGAFLYWEFEVRDGRTEQQAIEAMEEAFSGQELADCLLLYRGYKAKLPTVRESEKPTLRIHRPDEERGS